MSITASKSPTPPRSQYFTNLLGTRLLSVQPVQTHDFTLYFYALSDEALPNRDLDSAENREWLWAHPYALIELQHLETSGAKIRWPGANESGFDGFGFIAPGSGNITCISATDLTEIA